MRSRAIEAYKKTLKLSESQQEVLYGLLLGDACLETGNRGRTYRLKIEQSARHQPYVQHLAEFFQEWITSNPVERIKVASTGAKSVSWGFSTLSHDAFRFYAHQFYVDGVKRVPPLIHRWLTPRGLAYWYMDDGSMKSRQSKGVVFNTQGFARPDIERLISVLKARFNLHAWIRHQSDGLQIYVSGHSFECLSRLIEPHLLDGMRYKFPQPRRTHLPKE